MRNEENAYVENAQTEEFAEARENGALTVLGKFKDVSALARAYESLQAEFTRRSQKLRELERETDNFKRQKASSSGVEKLRKTAKMKREEQKEFDAFVADMVCPSVEEKKSVEVSMDEGNAQKEGVKEKEVLEENIAQAGEALVTEKLASGITKEETLDAQEEIKGEVQPSVVGSKAQGFAEDLFEKAVKDEGVRLRIIGEYLASLGKTNAPLTAVGGGPLASPPLKAKTVGEAGNMALLYFRKPNL